MTEPLVFLGGTCNEDPWRNQLTLLLDSYEIKYFNPVVENWDAKAQLIEELIKSHFNTINLFVITRRMTGVFSIAEVMSSAHEKPRKTIFCVREAGFSAGQLRSLKAVEDLVSSKGAHVSEFNEIPAAIKHIIRTGSSLSAAPTTPTTCPEGGL